MIKLNDTNANIDVLGEDELNQVVGGCHRRRRHCGGGGYWRKRRNHCGGYGGYDRSESYGEDYEGSDSYGEDYESDDEFSGDNVQVADVNVTINIAQVQG
jgi:hypothetical protein